MAIFDKKAVSPVIAIVLLLMMTVAAAGAAYFWLTTMQSRMQKASYKSIEKVMEATGRRVVAQATLCKPTYPYKGLVGYWMMEEGSGNKTYDKSGNGNTGTLYPGPNTEIDTDTEMWTDGQIEKALKFDGNDSYVEVKDADILEMKNTFSAVAWVKPSVDMSDGGWTILDNKGDNGGWGWLVKIVNGNLAVKLNVGDYSTGALLEGFSRNTWHHIGFTYNRDNGKVKLFQNGEKIGTGSYNKSINYRGPRSTYFGAAGIYALNPEWNGTIDEVRIYNRVLSQSAIEALYEAGKDGGRREVDITVRNIGSEEIPKATWVANLKHDGTNVETDAYNASAIDIGELATLKFYFKNFKPNTEYTIQLQGTGTSTTVSC